MITQLKNLASKKDPRQKKQHRGQFERSHAILHELSKDLASHSPFQINITKVYYQIYGYNSGFNMKFVFHICDDLIKHAGFELHQF